VPAAREPASETWTTRRLLAWMAEAFKARGLEAPQLQARVLLAHVLGCEELRLFTDPDRPATDTERARLRDLVGRALKDEPIQYLVGEWRFFGLPFSVDRRVLIPRPATETIVEHVLQHARVEPGFGGGTGEGLLIADICTGSGCIAVSLLKHLPRAHAAATDLSPEALEVAAANAGRHGVADRLDLLTGHLLEPLRDHPAYRGAASVHYLVSNPPYIPDHEWGAVAPNVREYEPSIALRGGIDGLTSIRELIAQGPDLLRPGGLILIEVADSTAQAALELLASRDRIQEARVLTDMEGLPRVICGRRER
jgi:release factor glutamine methyltransferase